MMEERCDELRKTETEGLRFEGTLLVLKMGEEGHEPRNVGGL